MPDRILLWVGFNIFVMAMLALDLGFFHRKARDVSIKEALLWSAVWIALALLFNLGIYFWRGSEVALAFLTGYLIEKSLSTDNIFVFLMIFSYFGVSRSYQYKILFWGIIGAVIMRAVFIVTGLSLIQKFHWVIYIFGIFLILTGIKMVFKKDQEIHPEKNPVLRLFYRFMPVTDAHDGGKFFVKKNGRYFATTLFIVLLVVETSDIMFAIDSIPAILAITTDPFIVYTSNIFAILGLRALYFALAGILQFFHYLHYGLSVILIFVGLKMLLANFFKMPISMALGVIALILVISIIASLLWPASPKSVLAMDNPLKNKAEPK